MLVASDMIVCTNLICLLTTLLVCAGHWSHPLQSDRRYKYSQVYSTHVSGPLRLGLGQESQRECPVHCVCLRQLLRAEGSGFQPCSGRAVGQQCQLAGVCLSAERPGSTGKPAGKGSCLAQPALSYSLGQHVSVQCVSAVWLSVCAAAAVAAGRRSACTVCCGAS